MKVQRAFHRRSAVIATVIGAFGLMAGATSCQNVHHMVTGEPFTKAARSSVRAEIEVIVDVQDSFYAAIGEVDRDAFEADLSRELLSIADVGLRFYPILSKEYGDQDARPSYMMKLSIDQLIVSSNDKIIEEEGQETRIESSLRNVRCNGAASIELRRGSAPPLVVSQSLGEGQSRPSRDTDTSASFQVANRADNLPALFVAKESVLAASRKSIISALRGTIEAVDRELER